MDEEVEASSNPDRQDKEAIDNLEYSTKTR